MSGSIDTHKDRVVRWMRCVGVFLCLLSISWLAYYHGASCGEFPWDDAAYRTAARAVLQGDASAGALVQGNYHPLTMFSLAFDEWLLGDDPFVQHATNVLLHAINACLVFVLIRSVFSELSGLLLLAACIVFVVHTVQVESVAWISERKNLLYAFFFLLTCVVYIMHLRRSCKLLYLLVIVGAVAAMLSKVQAVSLPLALTGILLMHSGWPVPRKRWLELLPILIAAIAAAWVGLHGQIQGSYVHAERESGFVVRAFVIAKATVLPYWSVLWPWSVSIIKPLPRVLDAELLTCGAVLVLFSSYWVHAIRVRNWRVVGMAAVLLALVLPVSQVVPFGSVVSADRYSYLPLVALLVVALGLTEQFRFRYTHVLLFAVSVPLLWATRERVIAWCDPIQLFAHALERFPNSEMAHMNIAAQFVDKGDLDNAELHLDKALVLDPTLLEARHLRADILAKRGMGQEAFDEYGQVIATGAGWSEVWRARVARSKLWIAQGNALEALNDLRAADAPPERGGEVDYLIGLSFAMLNDHASAIVYFERALERGTVRADVQLNLAISHGWLSNYDRSMKYARAVIRAESTNAEAYFILGLSEQRMGSDGCPSLSKAADLGHLKAKDAFDHHCR